MTSNSKELIDLAERCEKATGRDVTLDAEIGYVVDARCEAGNVRYLHDVAENSFEDIGSFGAALPAYTASLDAAMTLVPEGYEWGAGSWGNPDTDGPWAWCDTRQHSAGNDLDYGKAITAALALCAAALRARATQSPVDEGGR